MNNRQARLKAYDGEEDYPFPDWLDARIIGSFALVMAAFGFLTWLIAT